MDTDRIISQLQKERALIEQAISLLETLNSGPTASKADTPSISVSRRKTKGRGGSRISPEGRRKISEMMKKRWAARRRAKAKGKA